MRIHRRKIIRSARAENCRIAKRVRFNRKKSPRIHIEDAHLSLCSASCRRRIRDGKKAAVVAEIDAGNRRLPEKPFYLLRTDCAKSYRRRIRIEKGEACAICGQTAVVRKVGAYRSAPCVFKRRGGNIRHGKRGIKLCPRLFYRNAVHLAETHKIRQRLEINAFVPKLRVFFPAVFFLQPRAKRSAEVIALHCVWIDIFRSVDFRITRKFPFDFRLFDEVPTVFVVEPAFSAVAFG